MSISIPDFTNLALPFSLYNAESNRERGQHDKNEIVYWNRSIDYSHHNDGWMCHPTTDFSSSPSPSSIAFTGSDPCTNTS